MSTSTSSATWLASWNSPSLGAEPFRKHLFHTLEAFEKTGATKEWPDRGISPDIVKRIDFQQQSLLTLSWPALNGQTFHLASVKHDAGVWQIAVEVKSTTPMAPQFGMNSIATHAFILDGKPSIDSLTFTVNGQPGEFQ